MHINEESYGHINSIVLQLEKYNIEETNTVNNVEEININVTNNKVNQKDSQTNNVISEEEIKELKEFLNSTYSVEIEKIHINE